jgi:hypothetical protein
MTRTVDPFDELASMFLTDDDGPPPQPSIPNAVVEVLVVGHLPVRAGLWLTPYADAIARKGGPVALLRLDGEEPALQVMRGDATLLDERAGQPLPQSIEHIAGTVRTWIVRPAVDDQPSDIVAANADRVTILTGTNQAAVVAAYRLVKDLVEAARRAEVVPPQIGLAVIGAEGQPVDDLVEPLNRTTRECLGISVPLVLCLPRMDSDIRPTGYHGFTGEAAPALDEVVQWIAQAPPRPAEPKKDVPEEMKMTSEGPGRPDEMRITGAMEHDAERAAAEEPPPPPAWEPTGPAETPGPIRLTPKTPVEVEAAAVAASPAPEPDNPTPLASHLEGMTPLKPRCPAHEQVELAVDDAGTIHLLAREFAVLELRIVEAWAKAHFELIAMACPEQPFGPSRDIISHVFTDDPTRVADLHATDLHLHVLAPVEVEGKQGWYCAPLNRPQ